MKYIVINIKIKCYSLLKSRFYSLLLEGKLFLIVKLHYQYLFIM